MWELECGEASKYRKSWGMEEGPVGRGHSTDSELEKGGSLQVQGQRRGERTGINKSIHNKGGDVGQLDHGRPSV